MTSLLAWRPWLVAAIAAVMFLTNLGGSRLWNEDEPKNARCGVEMHERGDWVVPTYNDELRSHKPVLLYWAMRASYAAFGVSEFSARTAVGPVRHRDRRDVLSPWTLALRPNDRPASGGAAHQRRHVRDALARSDARRRADDRHDRSVADVRRRRREAPRRRLLGRRRIGGAARVVSTAVAAHVRDVRRDGRRRARQGADRRAAAPVGDLLVRPVRRARESGKRKVESGRKRKRPVDGLPPLSAFRLPLSPSLRLVPGVDCAPSLVGRRALDPDECRPADRRGGGGAVVRRGEPADRRRLARRVPRNP